MPDMTDATPTIEEMVTAVLPHLNWAEGNVQRCAERVAARTMSSEALAAAENNATALRAAIATLSSLSPLIEAARREAYQAAANVALAVSGQRADEYPRFAVEGKDEALGCGEQIHDAILALSSTFPAPASPSRPAAWLKWAHSTFGDVALDPKERTLRFIEEAIELVHAMGLSAATVITTADRVYGRDRGNIAREIGQAQACLECLSEAIGINADQEAGREFQRIQLIPQEEWDRRRSAKVKLGIALPAPPTTSDGSK